VVEAPVSGYYARPVDGLETTLTLELAKTAELSELLYIIDSVPARQNMGVWGAGRIVTSHNWHVAVKVNKFDVQRVRPGQRLTISFNNYAQRVPATVLRVLSLNNEDEDAVLVLGSNHVSGDTINLRSAGVRLYFQHHTGLRVDTSRIRFENGVRGVYTLDNGIIRFKRIDPLYEEDSFIRSALPSDPLETGLLRQFDQIVTKGIELEDGKIVE
jgi:hypothetical protein